MSKKVLFSNTYPYTPGKVDALVIVSLAKVSIPETLVLLPPFPEAGLLPNDVEFYRTSVVREDDIPEGITTVEVTPEAFLAIDKPNPNQVIVPDDEEIAEEMSVLKGKGDVIDRDWSDNMFGEGKGDSDD